MPSKPKTKKTGSTRRLLREIHPIHKKKLMLEVARKATQALLRGSLLIEAGLSKLSLVMAI